MLATRYRHPDDLKDASFFFRAYSYVDGSYASMVIVTATRGLRHVYVPLAKTTITMDDYFNATTGSITMPVWMAKNKELLENNEPLPVEESFP